MARHKAGRYTQLTKIIERCNREIEKERKLCASIIEHELARLDAEKLRKSPTTKK